MNNVPITLINNFVENQETLFSQLVSQTAWDERMRARKTASFGVAYNYSQMNYPEAPMPSSLEDLCARIEDELNYRPNNCLLNYYPDGEASMGFHSDTSEELQPGSGVAIVSLGAARSMLFRSKADKAKIVERVLHGGSLLFMSNDMQNEWLHAIPKAPDSGPRISATFRHIIK